MFVIVLDYTNTCDLLCFYSNKVFEFEFEYYWTQLPVLLTLL